MLSLLNHACPYVTSSHPRPHGIFKDFFTLEHLRKRYFRCCISPPIIPGLICIRRTFLVGSSAGGTYPRGGGLERGARKCSMRM